MKEVIIDPLTRVRGHGRVVVDFDDSGAVSNASFQVVELRDFEGILTGVQVEKMPLVTGRICGACSVAHAVCSSKTIEAMFAVEPPPTGKMLRELLHLAGFIHSHALHFFVLATPDFFMGIGADPATRSIFELLRLQPELARDALRLRSLGQKMVESIGGRGVHPVTSVGGGMTCSLTSEDRNELLDMAREALTLGVALIDYGEKLLESKSGLIEEFDLCSPYMAILAGGKINMYDGRITVISGEGDILTEFDASEFVTYIKEETLPSSNMKAAYFDDNGDLSMYQVGSLARVNCTRGMETPWAQRELDAFRASYGNPACKPVLFHHARLIELAYACERCVEMLEDDRILSDITRVELTGVPGKAAHGIGAVESPDGLLIHEYECDEKGKITGANILVATQQNNIAINAMVKECARKFSEGDIVTFLNGIEFGVRCFDPCPSCSTNQTGQMEMGVTLMDKGEVDTWDQEVT